MNGLKYIRTTCNLSLSELADFLGVSRQLISAWENQKKAIPEYRLEQLSNFFGIDKTLFGELSEQSIKSLIAQPMFRYIYNGKESYRYKPHCNSSNAQSLPVFFAGEYKNISLDEELALAKRRKKELLAQIDKIICWNDNPSDISEQIFNIERQCNIYETINDLLLEIKKQPMHLKCAFRKELTSVWEAMLIAYNLFDNEDYENTAKPSSLYLDDKDMEWMYSLSAQIRDHWNHKRVQAEERYSVVKNKKLNK